MKKEVLSTRVRKDVGHKLLNKAKAVMLMLTSAWLYLCTTGTQVMAAGEPSDPSNIVTTTIGTIVKIFPYVGGFFVVAGVFKLVMAYRNNNHEDQSSAAKDIVIGAVFIAFKLFIWNSIKAVI